jgi:hypothetical protein
MKGDKKEKWKREESHGVGGRTDNIGLRQRTVGDKKKWRRKERYDICGRHIAGVAGRVQREVRRRVLMWEDKGMKAEHRDKRRGKENSHVDGRAHRGG